MERREQERERREHDQQPQNHRSPLFLQDFRSRRLLPVLVMFPFAKILSWGLLVCLDLANKLHINHI
jgi:hypothetical protein